MFWVVLPYRHIDVVRHHQVSVIEITDVGDVYDEWAVYPDEHLWVQHCLHVLHRARQAAQRVVCHVQDALVAPCLDAHDVANTDALKASVVFGEEHHGGIFPLVWVSHSAAIARCNTAHVLLARRSLWLLPCCRLFFVWHNIILNRLYRFCPRTISVEPVYPATLVHNST